MLTLEYCYHVLLLVISVQLTLSSNSGTRNICQPLNFFSNDFSKGISKLGWFWLKLYTFAPLQYVVFSFEGLFKNLFKLWPEPKLLLWKVFANQV